MVQDLWVVFSIRVPFWGPVHKGAVLYWGTPKKGTPNLRELPFGGFWENVVIPWPTGAKSARLR